jgi:ribonuclease VapC
MIIDTSAIVAILCAGPQARTFAEAIENALSRRISAANFVEAAIVIDASRDPIASRRFDELVQEAHLTIEPVTVVQARIAREAYRDFGKGSVIRPRCISATASHTPSERPRRAPAVQR